MIVLGIDPGFANLGIAIVDFGANLPRVVSLSVTTTAKETRKRKLHQSSDDGRRIVELAHAIRDAWTKRSMPAVVAYELPGGSQGARSAHALGIAHGVVRASIAFAFPSTRVVDVTARDAKAALAGKTNASKSEMIAAAEAMVGGTLTLRSPELKAAQFEHAADAIGVALAAARAVGLDAPRLRPEHERVGA